jgi:hypothetical protein
MGDVNNQATIQRNLQSLLAYPREKLDSEIKGWLDLSQPENRAILAKAMIAISNHCGGHVIVGFKEKNGGWEPEEPFPSDLSKYSQDYINGIVKRYAEPAFHVEVYHVIHPDIDQEFPIIRVLGNQTAPIRSKRDGPNGEHIKQNEYYIRRPGPSSEPPQSGQEWDKLIGKCIRSQRDELVEAFRRIVYPELTSPEVSDTQQKEKEELHSWIGSTLLKWDNLVNEKLRDEEPNRYSHGIWYVAYKVIGDFKKPSLKELLNILRKIEGHETGWPPWLILQDIQNGPYSSQGNIEAWIRPDKFPDAAYSDFWRASPKGMLFLLRGYQEDSADKYEPGTVFDLVLPIWRIGECLLHAERFTSELSGTITSILFHAYWRGLSNRTLVSWANPRIFVSPGFVSKEFRVESEVIIPTEQISTHLPEIIYNVTRPLYETFRFFEIPMETIEQELSSMKKQTVRT